MLGEWAIKMTFDKPVRDIVIEKVTFGDEAMAMDHHSRQDGPLEDGPRRRRRSPKKKE